MSGTSREPGAVSINKVPFFNSCPDWALHRGVLAPYVNRIRFLEESSLSGGPLLTSSSECFSYSPPSPQRMVSLKGLRLRASGCRLLKVSPPSRGSLLLVSDIHIMGLPLSIANRIRCKGAPSSTRMLFSSRGFPEQGMGFLHRIPTFNKRIEFASIASPSPNENGFAPKGSTSPSEWDSHRDGHPLSPENHPLQTYGILVRRIIPSLANGFRF